MGDQTPSIELQNITKIYETEGTDAASLFALTFLNRSTKNLQQSSQKIALDDISLKIENGERLGIVGHNGAGKSTLLHIIAGLTTPSSGQIKVHGKVTSIMTLGLGLREDLSGRENIYLDGELQAKSRKEVDSFIEEIIAFAGLEEFIDYPLRTYSTGMKARLAFAMITCLEPEILIIDEALSAGDAAFSAKASARIKEICNKGKIVILVSHGMASINEMCNRCLWLEDGKVIADGPPSIVTKAYIESVRKKDEAILHEKFRRMIVSETYQAGFEILKLDICHVGENIARSIVNSGTGIVVLAEAKTPSLEGQIDLRLQIMRIDGLLLIDELFRTSLSILKSDHGHLRNIEARIDSFNFSKGLYEITLDLIDSSNSSLLAMRKTIFEVEAYDMPKGGRPVLLYPSFIEAKSTPTIEREP